VTEGTSVPETPHDRAWRLLLEGRGRSASEEHVAGCVACEALAAELAEIDRLAGVVPRPRAELLGAILERTRRRRPPMRVLIASTPELDGPAADGSLVAAAEAAVTRAGHVAVAGPDLAAEADVCVAIVGPRYRPPAPGAAAALGLELALAAAAELERPRLAFLVRENVWALPPVEMLAQHARLKTFQQRLREAGASLVWVASPAELELRLHDVLVELEAAWRVHAVREAAPARQPAPLGRLATGEAAPAQPEPHPRDGRCAEEPSGPPSFATTFVGRVAELAALTGALRTSRFVTVAGSGGVGKTRLVAELAPLVSADHPDGVTYAALASVTDPNLVATKVARAAGVRPGTEEETVAAIAARVGTGRMLLVLDGCEHLLEACANLAQRLLVACPGLRVLVTARRPLRIAGGAVCHIAPLQLPAPDPWLEPLEAVAGAEAVELFSARASGVQPQFRLDPANAETVTRICRHLDGIPLAIELAAARTGTMEVDDILAALQDRFRVLTGGGQPAMPPRQTLRAALDWCYHLLADEHRRLFRRLAAFPGTFDAAAADAVAPAAGASAGVTERLAALVETSLVMLDPLTPGRVRYRMLETVREYALERLLEAGEEDEVRRRHAGHLARTAARGWCEPELADEGQNDPVEPPRAPDAEPADAGAQPSPVEHSAGEAGMSRSWRASRGAKKPPRKAETAIPTYLSHSYRPEDREVNQHLWARFWAAGFAFTVDPKEPDQLSIPHLELMMQRSACFVAIAPYRGEQERYRTSPYIVFEHNMAVRARKPLLVVAEARVAGHPFDPRHLSVFSRGDPASAKNLDHLIRDLRERCGVFARQSDHVLGSVGVVLPPGRLYDRARAAVAYVLESAGYQVVTFRYDPAVAPDFSDVDRHDFFVVDVRAREMVHGLYYRFVPTIRLGYRTRSAAGAPPPGIFRDDALERAGGSVQNVIWWTNEDELVAQLQPVADKMQRPRRQFRSYEEGVGYFQSLGRSAQGSVFISNATGQNELARQLGRVLDLNNIAFFHYRHGDSIPQGTVWERQMLRRLESSELFVPLITADYWECAMCRHELHVAEQLERQKRLRIYRYVLEREPGGSERTRGADLTGMPVETQLERIVVDVNRYLTVGELREISEINA
jgi:predicted ATPase